MLNSNTLRTILKILTIIGIVSNIALFYLLFLADVDYSEFGTPSQEMIIVSNILSYLLQLFMAYGFWNLYLFLQKNGVAYLKKFGVILLSYTLLKIVYGAVSNIILSWHLGANHRTVSIDVDETTLIFISFSLLVLYLSNLLKASKQ